MATLGQSQIFTIAVLAGLPQPRVMAAVAMAESSGRTDVVNSIGCVGLWQINQPVHVKSHPTWTVKWLQNPYNNAIAAKAIYASQGLRAWEAYTNGAYARYLGTTVQQEATKTTVTQASWWDPLWDLDPFGLVPGNPNEDYAPDKPFGDNPPYSGAVDALSGVDAIADFAAKAGNWMSDPGNWIRVAYVIGGMALVIGGLVVIGRPLITSAATSQLGSAVKQFSKGK